MSSNPTSAPTAAVRRSPGFRTVGEILFLSCLVFVAFALLVERPFYFRHLGTANAVFNDRTWTLDAAVTSYLAAKSLFLFLPCVALVTWLRRSGRSEAGYWVFCIGFAFVLALLWCDIRLFNSTGNHVLDYASFLFSSTAWQWGGRDASWLGSAGIQVTFVMVAALLSIRAGRFVLGLLARLGRLPAARLHWFGVTAYVGVLATGYTAVESTADAPLMVALSEALPVSMPSLRMLRNVPSGHMLDPSEQQQLQAAYEEAIPSMTTPRPADERSLTVKRRPHVVLFVLESLRASAFTEQVMPRLHAWSQQGFRAERHHANANCSQFGLYSLLYGRWALAYDRTLSAHVPPQSCVTLRKAGYRCTFVTSADNNNYRRMGDFLNEQTFDRIVQHDTGDWVSRDRRSLEEVRRILQTAGDVPQFVTVFLMSTHFNYEFPEEQAVFRPYAQEVNLFSPDVHQHRAEILNRYHNSVHFLDDEIGRLLEVLPDKNQLLAVVTGDHGESMSEDGTFGHPSKLSDAQTRVPFALVGPGVPAASGAYSTSHVDVLPTLMHLLAGEPITLSGSHGTTMFRRDRPAGSLMVQGGFQFAVYQEWDELLITDRQVRMRLLVHRDEPRVKCLGFVDHRARAANSPFKNPAEREESLRNISSVLGRIRGND